MLYISPSWGEKPKDQVHRDPADFSTDLVKVSKDYHRSHGPSFFRDSNKFSFTVQAGEWIGEPGKGIWGEDIQLLGGFFVIFTIFPLLSSLYSTYGRFLNLSGTD